MNAIAFVGFRYRSTEHTMIRYSNITLYGVHQKELVDYLSNIRLDAYVSPTVNGFTVLYDLATIGYPNKLPKCVQSDSHINALLRQYGNSQQAAMVGLSSHLSKKFTCSVLAVFVIDSLTLWYHLSQNSQMLDEYVTRGDKHWQPGKALGDTAKGKIKGGNARELCNAFRREDAIVEVEGILHKPIGDIKFYDSMNRHEELVRAMGIRPCWTVGMNYLCFTGEDDFEAHYQSSCEEDDPSFEEALMIVKKTLLTSVQ